VSRFAVPDLGVGVGFRVPHFTEVIENRPEMDWFEIISENFMVDGGSPTWHLERLSDHYPVVPHGVSMSLGGAERPEHTQRLRELVAKLDPPWVSDHLCFTGTAGINTHDLLPVPYTRAVLDHMVDRIRRISDVLGRPFAIENPSSYMSYRATQMTEWEFLGELVERADCAVLLDVNNVFVSSVNHGFDPVEYLDAVPADRVVQIHLAGHSIQPEGYRLDTHDHPVCDEVWELYAHTIRRLGSVTTLIEWDGNIPTFERLAEEAARARAVRTEASSEVAPA
jgi:uncharacterized protein (UPF0276 family)